MPTISVITAVHTAMAEHLPATADSVLSQDLPDGWHLEWLVQEDGPEPSLEHTLPDDPRVRYHATRRGSGPATARTTALARSTGSLIVTLDGDDLLLPGALAAYIAAAEEHPEVGWIGSQHWLSITDRTEAAAVPEEPLLGIGGVPRHEVLRTWKALDRFPIQASTLCYRREALVERGGWPALARSEDAALLASISRGWPGHVLPNPVWVYRVHPSQTTQQDWSSSVRDLMHDLIFEWLDPEDTFVPS